MQSTSHSGLGPQTPEHPFNDEGRYTACSRSNSLSQTYAPGSPLLTSPDDSLQIWRDRVPEIPFLPDSRPRAVTPLGFRDDEPVDGAQNPTKPLALYQSSPWFKVPANIRRDILRLAFGDKRLHMSLAYRRYWSEVTEYGLIIESQVEEWQWFSCVCSRRILPVQALDPATDEAEDPGPWTDDCKSNNSVRPKIGAIGWLLSCRQNYAEGIDVLYSTNTIVLSGEAMISHISRILLPQRLASMTSIEVRWPLVPETHSKHEISSNFRYDDFSLPFTDSLDSDQIGVVLDTLSPTRLPSLRKLCISFEKTEEWYDSSLSTVYESILQRLRSFVKSRPKPLDECIFAFPEDFHGRITSSSLNGVASQPFSHVWDDLEGNLHTTRIPYRDSYPRPPFHLRKEQGVGFWIVKVCDRSSRFHVVFDSPSYSPISPQRNHSPP